METPLEIVKRLMQLTHVFVFLNFKGGVGKTTAALATSVELAEQGVPTLLIGLDEDPDIAGWLRYYLRASEQPINKRSALRLNPDMTSWRLITRPQEGLNGLPRLIPLEFDAVNPYTATARYYAAQLTKQAAGRGWLTQPAPLALIPDSEDLYEIEASLAQFIVRRPDSPHVLAPEDRLEYALRGLGQPVLTQPFDPEGRAAPVPVDFRAVVIDMPPARTKFMLQNVMRLGRQKGSPLTLHIVTPLDFSAFAIDAYNRFVERTLLPENEARRALGAPLVHQLGLLMMRYDESGEVSGDHDAIIKQYRDDLHGLVFETVIPDDKQVQRATIFRTLPQMLRPSSSANKLWPQLAREVMTRAISTAQ